MNLQFYLHMSIFLCIFAADLDRWSKIKMEID